MAPNRTRKRGTGLWLIIAAALIAILVLTPNALGAALGNVLASALVTAISAITGLLGALLGAN